MSKSPSAVGAEPRSKFTIGERPAPGGGSVAHALGAVLTMRCPYCHRNGTFPSFGNESKDIVWNQIAAVQDQVKAAPAQAGMRWCPNPECLGLVFTVLSGGAKVRTYPAELKQFDADGIPTQIASSIREAMLCHAQGCFRAAAIMVRRTLEELCDDKNAKGPNLEKRIEALSTKIVISKDLIDGAHELRFLGNDAAHIEAKEYQTVGSDETDVAIDLALALLHATYQTSQLVDRLKKLKAPGP